MRGAITACPRAGCRSAKLKVRKILDTTLDAPRPRSARRTCAAHAPSRRPRRSRWDERPYGGQGPPVIPVRAALCVSLAAITGRSELAKAIRYARSRWAVLTALPLRRHAGDQQQRCRARDPEELSVRWLRCRRRARRRGLHPCWVLGRIAASWPGNASRCAASAVAPLVIKLQTWLREPKAARLATQACSCPTTPPSGSCARSRWARKNWTFAGSDEGGRRAAAIYTLIQTAKLNDIDPQAWLADGLARLPDHPAKRIDELLREAA
jgi:IS66 C-terminal element